MPPKKTQVEEPTPILGRFKTQLRIGVVGLPNVGKSTFFNILTKSSVPAENYPFCTIEPNESRVAVPDERFDFLVEHFKPKNNVSAFLQVMDIAGLVQGASNGEGLGNAFLSHIFGCDAIFHMIRAFENLEIAHVDGDVDPIRDIKIIMDELRLKDIEYVNLRLEQMERTVVRANDKARLFEVDTLKKCLKILESGKWVKTEKHWSNKDIDALNIHMLLTAKPVIYLVNISEQGYKTKKNKWLAKIKAFVDENDPGSMIIPFSASFEQKLSDGYLDDAEKAIGSAFPRIIKAGFTQLQLEYFFTAGKDEVKAWTIRKGTKAPQAAGKIHTDFEKGFIMAEVMKFDDLKELGTEAAVKAVGKYRQEGKQYVMHDGDIIFFKFNAGAGLSKKK